MTVSPDERFYQPQPRYSKEEFARRGDEIYEFQVRPQVEEGNHGRIVAIDIETGDFEVDKSEIAACDRLEARHPDAQIWIVRIGSRHVRRFGGRTRRSRISEGGEFGNSRGLVQNAKNPLTLSPWAESTYYLYG
jgi:hypothetical protein